MHSRSRAGTNSLTSIWVSFCCFAWKCGEWIGEEDRRTLCFFVLLLFILFLFWWYGDILNMLLNGSKTNTIPPEVWWGFLELPLSTSLSDSQIMATFEILSKFFWDLRAPKQVLFPSSTSPLPPLSFRLSLSVIYLLFRTKRWICTLLSSPTSLRLLNLQKNSSAPGSLLLIHYSLEMVKKEDKRR